MKRPELRIASLFVLLSACGGEEVPDPTGGTSETGEEESTSSDDSTTKPPTSTTLPPDTTTTDSTTDTPPTSTTEPDPSTSSDDTTTAPDDTTTAPDDTTTAPDTTTTDTDGTTTDVNLCNNGVLDDGESCDGAELNNETCQSQGFDDGTLACAADCTFDTSGCVIATCGNGAIDGMEICDGDQLGGADCVSQGFASGTLACDANCGAFDTSQCVSCGNDVINGADVCDGTDLGGADCVSQGFVGGELSCLDDCSAFDTSMCTSCGNDIVDGSDVCDGADLAGETCVSQGYVSGNLACEVDCSAYDETGCESCGNGIVDGDDVCDGGDFGAAKCSDMGLEWGYLCCGSACSAVSAANCADELLESEPNDDGAVAVNTNDFNAAAADGPITANTVIRGSITPNGDDDVFAVQNPTNAPMIMTAEVFGANGPGTCPNNDTNYDSVLEVRSMANALLTTDDDGGIGYCSRISNFTLNANTTVYLRLIELGDNTQLANYHLGVTLRPVACGDGYLAPTEGCDDGNLVDNDGCSATCTVDSTTAEVDPNGTSAEADGNGVVSTGNTRFAGSISANNDLDRYRLDLAAPSFVRVETFSRGNDCVGAAFTTTLRLFNANGTALVNDSISGIQSCSAIVFPLPMGKSYVQVEEAGLNAQLASYLLQVKALTDVGMEAEPNDTIANASQNIGSGSDVIVFGDHANTDDIDVFAINVAECGSSIRIEAIEGDRNVETCESFGVDTFFTLTDSTGKQLEIDDDAGRGFCSLIDGTGTAPANPGASNLAAGTYYVHVKASDLSDPPDTEFIYRLAVTVRKP